MGVMFAVLGFMWLLFASLPALINNEHGLLIAMVERWHLLTLLVGGFWSIPLALWWLDEGTDPPILSALSIGSVALAFAFALTTVYALLLVWFMGADQVTFVFNELGERDVEVGLSIWFIWSLSYVGYKLDGLVRRARV